MRPTRKVQAVVALAVAFLAIDAATAGQGPTYHSDWRSYTTSDGLPHASIRAIHVEGHDLWVGTDGGLARRERDGWRAWTASDGLPAAPISAIDVDSSTGDLWLGTWGGGLVRFTGGRFDRFTQFTSGLAGDLVLDVVVVDGVVWAATNAGISSFEPRAATWNLYLEARADESPYVATAFDLADDDLFAATWYGPLLRFDAPRAEWEPSGDRSRGGGSDRGPHPGGDGSVAVAPGGEAVWSTGAGILERRARDGRGRARRVAVPGGFVRCLAAKSDSEAWLGTGGGLRVLTDWKSETWVVYERGDGAGSSGLKLVRSGRVVGTRSLDAAPPGRRVRCLAFEEDYVWIGTAQGLARGSGRTAWKGDESGVGGATRAIEDETVPAGEARIGILSASIKPISRPGASAPWPENPVDRVAVGRAVARANERTERSGRSFALAENLDSFLGHGWVTRQDAFPVLRDRDDVSGVVAYLGPDARIDSALALRTEMPTVDIASTPQTTDAIENPWVFRCSNNDPRRHLWLMRRVFENSGIERPAAVRITGAVPSEQLESWLDGSRALGYPPVADVTIDPFAEDLTASFDAIRLSAADVIFVSAESEATAELLKKMRASGLHQPVVASDRIVGEEFAVLAGPEIGEVIALTRCPHFRVAGDLPPIDESAQRRRPAVARKRASPQAERSYEAAVHLLAAIELAGKDRDAVREKLEEMSQPGLAVWKDGAWKVSFPTEPGSR
jgi:ABC-type branched-subunit amino acid transport system substrate-binding protein